MMMSKDGVLDALDAMIASFNAQTPAAEASNAQSKPEDLRGSQPGLGVLGIGRFPKQDTYTDYPDYPTDDPDPTCKKRLSRVEASIDKTPNAQTPKIALSRGRPGLAEKRAECVWHLAHSERVGRAVCAGCRRFIGPREEVLDLADDNVTHIDAEYRCLIAWGERWRSAARAALARPQGA
jgi:hypothetical protein